MNIQQQLDDLQIQLPQPPKPVAAYVPFTCSHGIVTISGQLPTIDGQLIAEGKVPDPCQIHNAIRAAEQCAINAIAVLKAAVDGDWDRLICITRLGLFVQSQPDFFGQSQIANGASELIHRIFGDPGRHARAAVGVCALPLNTPVELEMTATIKP